jgi:hypothetical protein
VYVILLNVSVIFLSLVTLLARFFPTLIRFAAAKLLGDTSRVIDTKQKQYAILLQRLALDINSTSQVSTPPVSAYDEMLVQIANHMRVCVEIGQGTESIRGIAASEPILSEAASYVMRWDSGFKMTEAPSDVLSGFIHQSRRSWGITNGCLLYIGS